jgi:DNA-binding NarL/FixJ family response regulator
VSAASPLRRPQRRRPLSVAEAGADRAVETKVSAVESEVAVLVRSPIFRHGLAATLREHGYRVEFPEELSTWRPKTRPAVALISLRCQEDWLALSSMEGTVPVIGIVPYVSPEAYGRALEAGASTIIGEDVSLAELVDVVHAALSNRTLVSIDILQAFATSSAGTAPALLAPHETEWLRALARGTTVASVAHEACYSEREMYRVLGRLYRRIGAANRAEAIALAARRGLLD